jgi:hypothetical protein
MKKAWTSLAAVVLTTPLLAQSTPAPTSWKPYTPPSATPAPPAATTPSAPTPTTPVAPAVPTAQPVELPLLPNPSPIINPPPSKWPAKPSPLPLMAPADVPPLKIHNVVLPPPPPEYPSAETNVPAQTVSRSIVATPTSQPVQMAQAPRVPVQTAARPTQAPVPVQAVVQTPLPEPKPLPKDPPKDPKVQIAPPVTPSPSLPAPGTLPGTVGDPYIPKMTPVASGLPNQEDLFRLQGDLELNQRILRDTNKMTERFPMLPSMVPAGTQYTPKTAMYQPMQAVVEPNYVIHRRLFFEEMNSERAGWDAGPAQSVFSSAYFFRDIMLLPSRLASKPRCAYDSGAGKCRPGDPTPYYYYPHGVTWFGAAVGTAFYAGLGFVVY